MYYAACKDVIDPKFVELTADSVIIILIKWYIRIAMISGKILSGWVR